MKDTLGLLKSRCRTGSLMALVRSRTAVAALLAGAAAVACGGSTHLPGPAAKLAFTVQPSNTSAGIGIAAAVAIQDASGNTMTSATNAVTVALRANPVGGTLSGTTTVVAVNGVATFSNLSVDKCGASYSVTATASGLAGATSTAFDVTNNCWSTKASMPTPRTNLAVGAVNGVLYAVGGYGGINGGSNTLGTVEAYDPSTNSWATKASMPTARSGLSVGVVNGVLYAVGGYQGLNTYVGTVEAYDPSTNSWTTKASMPTRRYVFAVGVVNGVLYAVGGVGATSYALGTVEAYDPSTNSWATKASMPTGRNGLSVGVVNGVLYAVGGVDVTSNPVGTVEAYDPSTNSWATKASMPTASQVFAIGVVNGVLYAVGDYWGGNTLLGTVEAYDPSTNSWATKKSIPTARNGLSVGVVNGVLYAVGGTGATSNPVGTVEAYQP